MNEKEMKKPSGSNSIASKSIEGDKLWKRFQRQITTVILHEVRNKKRTGLERDF